MEKDALCRLPELAFSLSRENVNEILFSRKMKFHHQIQRINYAKTIWNFHLSSIFFELFRSRSMAIIQRKNSRFNNKIKHFDDRR